MFRIFDKRPKEFPGRIDPSDAFRERRRRQRRRTRRRRLTAVLIVVGAAVAMTFGFRAVTGVNKPVPPTDQSQTDSTAATDDAPSVEPSDNFVPVTIRGVHVTMPLMTLPGKLDEYLAMTSVGLNTLQVDIKDEEGRVAFSPSPSHLARKIGAVGDFYDPAVLVAKAKAAGVFLVGRLVVFEDPILARERPQLSIKRRGGGNWQTSTGLGWTNPYMEAVWRYNVDIAEAAAEAGFDEIMFDYVRFPSDGQLTEMVFPGKRPGPTADTIARFLAYARQRLDPLDVELGAAIFGLAATRNIGIGQNPRQMSRYLDVVHPMVYPAGYGSGEFNINEPSASPGQIVSESLQDFREALTGRDADVVPWLQDYGGYKLPEIRAQIAAAERWQSRGYLLWNADGVYTDGALDLP